MCVLANLFNFPCAYNVVENVLLSDHNNGHNKPVSGCGVKLLHFLCDTFLARPLEFIKVADFKFNAKRFS